MQQIRKYDSGIKANSQKQDVSSKKTRSLYKPIKSQKIENIINQNMQFHGSVKKPRQTQKSYKGYSAKDSKCNSDIQYKIANKESKHSKDIDGKTQINKDRSKSKQKQIEDQLQHQELVRESLANSYNDQKIKIGSKKRQIIDHDILHPPFNLKTNKSDKKQLKFSQTESQRMQDDCYDEIINEINLNNLESKVVVYHQVAKTKKQQTFLAKIQQSQSEVIASPLNYQKITDFNNQSSPMHSPTKLLKVENEDNSILKMGSIEEQALNQSVQRTFKDKHQILFRQQNQINVHPSQSEISSQRLTEKKSNKIDQSKVMIVSKIVKKDGKQQNKLTLVTGILQEKVKLQKQSKEQQQRKRLNEQISQLRQAVKQLKIQKIKARVQMNMTIDSTAFRSLEQRSRYETLNTYISQKQPEEEQSNYRLFGKIRKNRSLSKKDTIRSQQLSLQKELDLPQPLINISKLPKPYSADRKLHSPFIEQEKAYKTMNLERIVQQNIQQSTRFHDNLITSYELPIYGSNLRSNKINMRCQQICNQVLNKFQSNDKKFKRFMHLSSARSRAHSHKIQDTQILKQKTEDFELEPNNQFEGVIIKNKYTSSPLANKKYEVTNKGEYKVSQTIKEGSKIVLSKIYHKFRISSIPQIPQNPSYSTSNEEIMQMISQILPLSNIQYSQKDLEDCILKKYKNCIMFELKRFASIKIVWYFNGRLYIGGWDTVKNEKNGFGKQIVKGKYYYQGDFLANKKHGKGSFLNQISCYEGEWIHGQMQGQGIFLDQSQKTFYAGQLKQGIKNGKGHYQYEGNIFQGIFVMDKKQGFGIQLFKNGDRFIGNYSNGKFDGQGKYIWQNGSYYSGPFREGYRQGLGKWQSGTQNYELYIGQFVRDKKQGTGKYIWGNKCVYEGNFFNDLKHGIGSILYPDGRYIEGAWTQGVLTDVLNKVTEANREEPLQQPKSRTLKSKTLIKVVDIFM